MTDDEALALKPGDVVKTRLGGRQTTVTVVWTGTYFDDPGFYVMVRRLGKITPRRFYPVKRRDASEVEYVGPADPPTAHVYADWLEENGEPRAAEMLRKAFPLA